MGSPNSKICRLTKFVGFVGLPQMWKFADLGFADPSFIFGLKTFANPQKTKLFPYKYRHKVALIKFLLNNFIDEQACVRIFS